MPDTTTTRCEVVDQIVEWTSADGTLNIQSGDLILENGRFQLVADVRTEDVGYQVKYSLRGLTGLRRAHISDLVAVRRYTETSEE